MVEPGSVAIGTLATIAGISGYGAMKLNAKAAKEIQSQVDQQCKANDLLLKETSDARRIAEEAQAAAQREVERLKEEVKTLQTEKETLAKAKDQLQATITNAPVAQVAPPPPSILSTLGIEPAPAPAPAPAPEPTPEPTAVVTGTPVDVVGETPLQKFVRENEFALRTMREDRQRKRKALIPPPSLPPLSTETEMQAFDRRVAERERASREWKADMDRLTKLAAEAKARSAAAQLGVLTLPDQALVDDLNRQAAEAEAEKRSMEETLAASGTVSGTTTPPIPSPARPDGYIDGQAPPEPSVLAKPTPPTEFAALPDIPSPPTPTTLGTKLPPTEDEPRLAFPPPSSALPPLPPSSTFSLPPPSSTLALPKPIDARRKTQRNKPSPPALPKQKTRTPSETRRIDVKPAPAPEPEPTPAPAPEPAPTPKPFGRTPPTNIGKWAKVDTPYLNMGTQKKGALRKKKLRTRRGVKQNVRRPRGGKNRANRTSSHTRRRS